jgi:flagellar basal-body rod protein FlgB
MNLFGPAFDRLGSVLDIVTAKHAVIASNIANVDTPGYKAKELDFREAYLSSLKASGISMKKTMEKHFSPAESQGSYASLISEQVNDFMRNDGNNVNVDKEMVDLAQNSIMFDMAAQMMGRKFESLKYAISEGRRS